MQKKHSELEGAPAAQSTGALLIDFAKSAMWPLVVLLGFALFYTPVRSMLDAIARQSSDIQTIKLGNVELDIRATDLPKPDSEVATAIGLLDQQSGLALLSFAPATTSLRCSDNEASLNQTSNDLSNAFARMPNARLLVPAGLVDLSFAPKKETFISLFKSRGSAYCLVAATRILPLGVRAQTFLKHVLAAELHIKNPT